MKNYKNYWKKYWSDKNNFVKSDNQKSVGRTKNGVTIKESNWARTINYILEILSISEEDDLLELCCGNGEVIGNLAPYCKSATGVDFSNYLLKQFSKKIENNVHIIQDDVLKIDFKKNSFDIIILYFAIQHFDEKESINLIENSLKWLKKGGKLFIGDIPDESKKWKYISKPEYKLDYIRRVVDNEPKIGSWFHKDFFLALQYYFSNINVKVIDQPSYQINSSYRYDVLIEKQSS